MSIKTKKSLVFVLLLFLGIAYLLIDLFHERSPATNENSFNQNNAKLFHSASNPLSIPSVLSVNVPNGFAALVKKIKPAVVNIATTTEIRRRPNTPWGGGVDPFFRDFFGPFYQQQLPPQQRSTHSLGTGFIINERGDIITNNHVVSDADEILVKLDDGRELKVDIVGRDIKLDIAVLRPETTGTYPYVTMGNSDVLEVGEWVIAIGNPFGLGHTVTAGIVSAKARVLGTGPYDDFIQTDASINPGNSGGPLFNTNGEVVGINTAIIATGQGIGFAIPINMAKDVLPQLLTKGSVSRGWLGVAIRDMSQEEAQELRFTHPQGAWIAEVVPGGPADKIGIKPGDIVVEFNGAPIDTSHMLPTIVARIPPDSKASLVYLRDKKRFETTVVLGALDKPLTPRSEPSTTAPVKGLLGLSVRDLTESESRTIEGGVVITAVDPNSMAASVGIQKGDLLVEINGDTLANVSEFKKKVESIKNGEVIRLSLARGPYMYYFAFRKE